MLGEASAAPRSAGRASDRGIQELAVDAEVLADAGGLPFGVAMVVAAGPLAWPDLPAPAADAPRYW
jgi:hypothetical protein